MANKIENQYYPDTVSLPGETLAEILVEKGMSQNELAERMGQPKKTINEIIHGTAMITPEIALQLERVLNVPARLWLSREQHYQQHRAKIAEESRLKKQFPIFKAIPIGG